MSKPLVVIPNYMSREEDMEILGECVQSIRQTVSDTVDILIVDDDSPQPWLVDVFESRYERYGFELAPQARERGLLAHRQRRPRARARRGPRGDPDERGHRHAHAGLARQVPQDDDAGRSPRRASSGALLLYPNRLIQHAGLYFSPIANMFEHRFRYAPGNLPEALVAAVCPVTGAFQYIRPEVLERVGLYDPDFRLGFEDVDYDLRVFQRRFRVRLRARRPRRPPRVDVPRPARREGRALAAREPRPPAPEMGGRGARRARAERVIDAREDVLFVAQSGGGSCYHRTMLPAVALGCDWCGLDAPPPRMVVGRGAARGDGGAPDLGAYRLVVLHIPEQPGWLELIQELRAGGTIVLCDLDYDVHALQQDPEALARFETVLGLCDGVLCANRYLAGRYARFNPRTFVCESGIDLEAYALTRPEHDTVNIGWSGTTLAPDEMRPWLQQVLGVLQAREITNFVSIGQPFGDAVAETGLVSPERCLAIPPMLPEQVPAAMSIFDLVFDPPGTSAWRLGRSQLRWLEAGAWGIPLVGDPHVYPRIADGVTGFHAADPAAAARAILRVVDDPGLRTAVGERARREVTRRYSMAAVAPQWARAFEQVAA